MNKDISPGKEKHKGKNIETAMETRVIRGLSLRNYQDPPPNYPEIPSMLVLFVRIWVLLRVLGGSGGLSK